MINCVRWCISYLCYKDIYEKDPPEHEDIDVRFNQFKSCWIKEQKEWNKFIYLRLKWSVDHKI
jgi:hypothetical protein